MADPTLTLFYEFARNKSLVASQGLGPTLDIVRTSEKHVSSATGLLETVAPGNAGFDHDPVTGLSLGLLVEEARINIARQSGNLVSAPWTSIQTPAFAVNNAISPRGILEATLITDNNATNREGVQQSVVVPNDSATHVSSIFVKKTTGGTSPTFGFEMVYADGTGTVPVQIRLNTDTGVTNGVGGGAAQDFGDYWRLWGLSTNNGTGNTTLLIKILPALAAHGSFVDVMSTTGSAHAWGCQAELGSVPTSYIETFAVPVTRQRDAITTTDVSWLTVGQGTLFTDTIVPTIPETGTGTPFIIALDDGGNANQRILHTYFRQPGVLQAFAFMNKGPIGGSISNGAALNLVKGDILRMATSWDGGGLNTSHNGLAVLSNATLTVPVAIDTFRLESPAGTGQHNGHIRGVRYYNVRKDNQFLEDLSSGLISEASLSFSRNLARPLAENLTRTF